MTETRALWARESLATFRLARTPWLLALSSLAMGGGVLLAGLSSHGASSDVGRKLFHVAYALAIIFVTLVGPAIAGSAIALEREGKTWEALVMAGVSTRAIDRGKFLGAYTHLLLYVLALVPALGVPHLFGGPSIFESLLALVMVLAIGALTVRFGLVASAMVGTARTALLVTVLASAVLAGMVAVIGVAATESLRREVGMSSLIDEGPVFWPVALVHEHFSFDYVRYLVIAPVAGVALLWSAMRGLGLGALETAFSLEPGPLVRRARANKRYLLLAALAVVLGLMPGRDETLLGFEAAFASCAVIAIVAVAGSPSPGSTLGRSIGLVFSTTAGVFVMLAVARVTSLTQGSTFIPTDRDVAAALSSFLLYAPAFAVFATGATALARTLLRRGKFARAAGAAAIGAAIVVPLIAGVFAKATGASPTAIVAASPVGVLWARESVYAIVVAPIAWGVLGALLLFVTYRRERRA